MKKIYAIIIVLFALVTFQANAQLSCNAAFTTQSINATTVKFNPAITDSPTVYHSWNFIELGGSGYYSLSHTVSPTNIFPTGTFSVGHGIYRQNPNGGSPCFDSTNQIITITQGACLLSANFYKYPSQTNYLEHYFSNNTTYLSTSDSIRWTFGDGTSSNLFNPTHIYANNGIYNVCLRVIKRNLNGTLSNCVSEICKLDTVAYQCNLQAYFDTNTDTTTAPATIQFYNYSYGYTNADSLTWNFGDGSTVSHVNNPNHVYTAAGVYTICLYIKKNNNPNGSLACRDTFCKQIVIYPITTTCNLLANFTYYRDSLASAPRTYHFLNTSAPLTTSDSIRWIFGDGTSSNQVNPNHTYSSAGSYNVCLRVIKRNPNGVLSNCIAEKCYVVAVTNSPIPCTLSASFVYSNVPPSTLTQIFYNTSTGFAQGDSIRWKFGDGTSSTALNPTHTYANAGIYNVCLWVKKPQTAATATLCVSEICHTDTINVPCTLIANFYSYRDSSPTVALNTYHFINTSAPLAANDSIRWSFGDGTFSNEVNPAHTYANYGTYNVCLRIIKRNANGTLTNCVSEKCYTITVVQLCNISANYTWYADSVNYKKINFTNNTIAPSSATTLWNFGDGSTATTWNAAHTYAQAGRYYVCLRVQYGTCVSYKCDTITIIAPPPVITCNQLSLNSSAVTNTVASFAPTFLQSNVQYTYTFGDGTGAQGANASHQYTSAGTYTVCLTAYRNNNCASTTCNTITILSTINCNNITLSINDKRDSLVPNRIMFTAISNLATTSQQWTITRIPTTATTGTTTINTNNPTYLFLDSGYYNVCVKATYSNGCIKTFCKTIHITQPMPGVNTCTLQVYPNPASTSINASVTLVQPLMINASVYNNMAVLVAQKQQQGVVGNNIVSVNIATLPAGVYTLRVTYGNQICYATFVK